MKINPIGYRISEPLETNGRTRLSRAEHTQDHRQVVLKTLASDYPSPHEIAVLRREWELLKKLEGKPGIIQAADFVQLGQSWAIVLEDGGVPITHATFRDKKDRLDLARFFEFAIQAAEVLEHLHNANIIHKDIKPNNFLLDSQGKVKLIDFSIASTFSQEDPAISLNGDFQGSPAYMSPEQTGRMNRPLDYRTDFYSLGITFYHWLSKELPFQAENTLDLIYQHLAKSPPHLTKVDSTIPQALADIINKLLAKEAIERYQTGAYLKEDLQKAQSYWNEGRTQETFALSQGEHSRIFSLSSKLYGRDEELKALSHHFQSVTEGERSFLLISGQSGEGKSALVKEFYRDIAKQNGYFIEGKFEQFERNRPYIALIQAFSQLAKQLLRHSDNKIEKLAKKVNKALHPNGKTLTDLVPEWEHIIGPQKELAVLKPAEAENRLLSTIEHFVSLFSAPKHPLVIFLDDLQWADTGTLKLLEHWLTRSRIKGLMVIGTCRSNEIADNAHAVETFKTLEEANALNTLELSPLSTDSIQSLIADSLSCPFEEVATLSKIIREKTGGTAFFITQILQNLYKQEMLRFSSDKSKWVWDEDAIREIQISSNVVDYLIDLQNTLPEETKRVLSFAACLGNRFDLDTLAIICDQSNSEVARALEAALKEGYVLALDSNYRIASQDIAVQVNYRFQHDQVQNANYQSLEEKTRVQAHLNAGRVLYKRWQEAESTEKDSVIQIARHFERAGDVIIDEDEQWQVAEIYLLAGQQAKASLAYDAATRFFAAGLACLEGDMWKVNYALTLNLHLEYAETSFLTKETALSEMLLDRCLAKARSNYEKAFIFQKKTELCAFNQDNASAYEAGRQGLKLLGLDISENPTKPQLIRQLIIFKLQAPKVSIDSLQHAEQIEDKNTLLAIEILTSLIPPSYIHFGPAAAIYLALICLNKSAKQGIAYEQAMHYISVGFFMQAILNQLEEGSRLSNYGMAMENHYPDNTSHKSGAHFLFAFFSNHWHAPLATAIPHFKKSINYATEAGDYFHASFSATMSAANIYLQGRPLNDVTQSIQSAHPILKTNRQYELWGVLQEINETVTTLTGQEHPFEAVPTSPSININGNVFNQHGTFIKITRLFFQKELEETQKQCDAFPDSLKELMQPSPHSYNLLFISFQNKVRLERKQGIYSKSKTARAAKKLLKQFETWTDRGCFENFSYYYWLIKAEWEQAHNRFEKTLTAYQKAADYAQQSGSLSFQALANELAGEYALQRQATGIARHFLSDAVRLYKHWGAEYKVQKMHEAFEELLRTPHSNVRLDETAHAVNSTLTRHRTYIHTQGTRHQTTESTVREKPFDYMTAVRSSQTLSEEIQVESLLKKLMNHLMTGLGAEKAVLLLDKEDTLKVTALSRGENDIQLLDETLEESRDVPKQIIRYSMKTKESIILNHACKEALFADDAYIKENQTKSVLCVLLNNRGSTAGAIYLENNQATSIFTEERITLANLVASQAAISLQNAQLYEELSEINNSLEEKVKIRTEELKKAQQELIAYSRQAGMSEVATSVLHNIGNVLNSVNVSVSRLQGLHRTSSIASLTKLKGLLSKHLDNTADFFTNNPKGQKTPQYIVDLSTKIENEQTVYVDELKDLSRAIDHIKEIVVAQQSYATIKTMREPTDVRRLIEDSLKLQENSWKNHQIELNHEFEDIPVLEIDRGRLMQILLNLISNAKHALKESQTRENRALNISVKLLEAEQLEIKVKDTGVGISEENLEQIFQYGFTTKKSGHGFGLHHCANSAREMGGSLTATSDGLGKGATFSLRLPAEVHRTD